MQYRFEAIFPWGGQYIAGLTRALHVAGLSCVDDPRQEGSDCYCLIIGSDPVKLRELEAMIREAEANFDGETQDYDEWDLALDQQISEAGAIRLVTDWKHLEVDEHPEQLEQLGLTLERLEDVERPTFIFHFETLSFSFTSSSPEDRADELLTMLGDEVTADRAIDAFERSPDKEALARAILQGCSWEEELELGGALKEAMLRDDAAGEQVNREGNLSRRPLGELDREAFALDLALRALCSLPAEEQAGLSVLDVTPLRSLPQGALHLPELETLAAYRTFEPGLARHMVVPLEWDDGCPETVLLRHRTLGHLPAQLCAHPDLRVLDLTGSRAWAPDSLWANATLTSLRIDLDEIPHEGSGWEGKGRDPEGLQCTRELQFGGTFKTLPAWIFQLPDLERLTLRGVGLQALPDEIGTMKYLRVLDLGEASGLKTLPDALMECTGLKMVRLVGQVQHRRGRSRFRDLRWDSLPRSIMEHPTLKTLTLDGGLAGRVRADLDALEERGVEVFIFPEPHHWLDFLHLMMLDIDPLSDVHREAREEIRDRIEEAAQGR